MFYWLLCENSAWAKVVRTVLQGFVGVLVASLPQVQDAVIEMLTSLGIPHFAVLAIVPVIMAVLSFTMAKAGEFADKRCADTLISTCPNLAEELNAMGTGNVAENVNPEDAARRRVG